MVRELLGAQRRGSEFSLLAETARVADHGATTQWAHAVAFSPEVRRTVPECTAALLQPNFVLNCLGRYLMADNGCLSHRGAVQRYVRSLTTCLQLNCSRGCAGTQA